MSDHSQPIADKTGVLFVSSTEWPGADTFIHTSLMRALDRSRYDVHVACSAVVPGGRTAALEMLEAIPNLHIRQATFGPSLTGRSDKGLRLLRGALPTLASLAGLVKYIRQQRITVVHATDRPRDALAGVLLARLTGAKSVVHVHVKCAEWMSRPVRWAFGQADALVGVSRFVADSLVQNGYAREKTHAVLNAIDPAAWDFRLDPGSVRREFGLPAQARVIACAARLFRGKGQDDVIRALATVRKELPDVRLLIIGPEDRFAMKTGFLAELQALTASLGLEDRVIFTGPRTDMPALMAACDVFALPSLEEPFGLVYLEAMAMKKPVVALNIGGAPEVVEHGKSGLLCAPRETAMLADSLLTLLRDPVLRARMGEYGRRRVEAHFTPERMAQDAAKVYATLASSRNRDSVRASHHARPRVR